MTIYINDIDVTSDVIDSESLYIYEEVADYGQLIVSPSIEIRLSDPDRKYNSLYPSGMFYNYDDYSEFKITIEDNNKRIYKGILIDVISDTTEFVTLSIQSELETLLDRRFIYVSDDESNPAEILRDICELYSIPYDASSINVASAIYEADAIRCTAWCLKPDQTLLSFVQQIAEIGIARIFAVDNELRMDVFNPYKELVPILEIDSSVTSSINYALSEATYTTIRKQPAQGYSVQWIGEPDAEYLPESSLSEKYVQQISGGNDNIIRIMTYQSAIWIGERWLAYLNTVQTEINVDISRDIGTELELMHPIQLSQDSITTIFEITGMQRSSTIRYNVTGRTI